MPINTQSIAYRDGETELTGLLASDDSRSGERPGILVVHGGAGLDTCEGARDDSRNSAWSCLPAICMATASPAIASA